MNGSNAVTSAPLFALSVFSQQECGCSIKLGELGESGVVGCGETLDGFEG